MFCRYCKFREAKRGDYCSELCEGAVRLFERRLEMARERMQKEREMQGRRWAKMRRDSEVKIYA